MERAELYGRQPQDFVLFLVVYLLIDTDQVHRLAAESLQADKDHNTREKIPYHSHQVGVSI